ncbi:alpha/beta hydrolase [Nocardioides psychrotolerans]|uniref:alpha/beta hydrolase family protein n=1 Tax=Nocardioides psychrotolerans TaxID=1005945 RepID=UPI003137D58A
MHRRTLLSLPALGVVGLALASCGEDAPVREPDGPGEGRTAYGTDPSQYGELYLPDGTPRGVVVVIHGGFWKAEYDLSLGRPLATSLAAEGWAAWNIEYRRVGNGGGTPETFDDVSAAIDALGDLEVDTSTVVTLGHSAGGHLAAWAASRGRDGAWPDRVPVTHVISQAGVLDLVASERDGLGGGAAGALLGHAPGPQDAAYDPMQQVPLEQPVWCVHGTADTIVPIGQSGTYVSAATAAGAQAELVAVDGDHFVVIDPLSQAWTEILAILDGIG